MKQLVSFIASLLFIMGICQAQDSLHNISPNASIEKKQSAIPQINSKEYFLAKSSKLNTTGWVLIGVGAVLGTTGIIIYNKNKNGTLDQLGNTYGGVLLTIVGGAMVVVGIPLVIRSGYYKRKAMAMTATLNLENYQSGLAIKHFPSIGLSIRL
jgi:hypothetical protein